MPIQELCGIVEAAELRVRGLEGGDDGERLTSVCFLTTEGRLGIQLNWLVRTGMVYSKDLLSGSLLL